MRRVRVATDWLRSHFVTWDWGILLLIVVASFGLRWYRIDQALIGFHSVNEAFYTNLGKQYLEGGVFAPFVAPLDANNPPLYSFFVRFLFDMVGVSVAAARAVSVFASAATVVGVFLLGRELYGKAAGLMAAVVFGLSPGAVLVGGNAQTDGLLVLLMVSSMLAFVRSVRSDHFYLGLFAGVLLGLAALTKLSALVLIPAYAVWYTWGQKGFSWIKTRRSQLFSVGFIATAVPWFVARLIIDDTWRHGQAYLFSTLEPPTLQTISVWLGSELFWLVSPAAFFLFFVALGLLLWRRSDSDVLVLILLAVNVIFYLFYSSHTYYLLPAVPLVALAVGALADYVGATSYQRAVPIVVILGIVMSLSAAVVVGGKKWGGWYCSDVRDIVLRAGYTPEDVVLAVDKDVLGGWSEPLIDAFPGTELVSYPLEGPVTDGKPVLHLRRHEKTQSRTDLTVVPNRRHGPVAFGYTVFFPATIAVHVFGVTDLELVKVGPWWRFGVIDTTGPSTLRVEVLRS